MLILLAEPLFGKLVLLADHPYAQCDDEHGRQDDRAQEEQVLAARQRKDCQENVKKPVSADPIQVRPGKIVTWKLKVRIRQVGRPTGPILRPKLR